MLDHPIFDQSDRLTDALAGIFDVPLFDDSARFAASKALCAMSINHAIAMRLLVQQDLITSAMTLHRSQFEALVRAVWLFYAAHDAQVPKLAADLSPETAQGAKGLPSINEMLTALSREPRAAQPYAAFAEFRQYSWAALNSFVHAGIHPLHRERTGFPLPLIEQLIKQANALSVIAAMQVAILTGRQQLVRQMRDVDGPFRSCLPAHRASDN